MMFLSYKLPSLACVMFGGGTIVSDAMDADDSLDEDARVGARSRPEEEPLIALDEVTGECRGGAMV